MKSVIKYFAIIAAITISFTACSVKNQYDNLNPLSIEDIKPIKKDKKMLGIAFGGGGVRGFVHLGVIKALEEEGIEADIITGSSAGSIVASLYASGMNYKQMMKIVEELDEGDLWDVTFASNGGMIQGQKLALWINEKTKNMKIENTQKKLGITVTDLTHGKSLLLIEGDMGHASQTSSSIPGGFVPVFSKDKMLVDGGVLSLVPVDFNRALGADIVIGVDVYCGKIRVPKENMLDIMYSATRLQNCKINEYEIKHADFIIQPKYEPQDMGSFDGKMESIQVGYEAAKKIMPAIKKRLKEL